MANDPRRQQRLLAGLLVVLIAVAWWQFGGSSGPARSAAAPAARRAAAPASPAGGVSVAPDQVLARGVGLERLEDDRPAPEEGGRDPFRSGGQASRGGEDVATPAVPVAPTPSVAAPPPGPPIPTGPPPIAVKFIGVVSRRDVGKVAVLSDGKNVYYGRAGEIVDGRWRIVSIGEESLQIEYADGRGRQTVRLTG